MFSWWWLWPLLGIFSWPCSMPKSIFGHMQITKAQNSLCISAVWSGPSLSAKRIIVFYIIMNVPDDTLRMRRMILICTFSHLPLLTEKPFVISNKNFHPKVLDMDFSISEFGHIHFEDMGFSHYDPSHLDLLCLQRYLYWSVGMKELSRLLSLLCV